MVPRILIWAIPGIVLWIVLLIVAGRVCTEWRAEKVKYGFSAVALLIWWLPNLLIGETGASEVEQFVLLAGFPIVAIFLGGLVIAEIVERRKQKLTAES